MRALTRCEVRRCNALEIALLIGAKRTHTQPPGTNNPAPQLLRRRLLAGMKLLNLRLNKVS